MATLEIGLYDKFTVVRNDGDPKDKHQNCAYFVLDLDHDIHARAAIAAYEQSCQQDKPLLAADLRAWLRPGRS